MLRSARLLACALLASAAGAAELPDLTAASLLDSERFWPYRVTLTRAWQPEGRQAPLAAGTPGVLIRVEPRGVARVDFSADGKHPVPIGATDLVESANQIRRGELSKPLPNFVHAIRSRLIDPEADTLKGLAPERLTGIPGFLCVFADPAAADFETLVTSVAPLRERHGVVTLLFPQGSHADGGVRERLRALEWKVPFVYDFLSEPYTRTLIDEHTPMPVLLLQTDEGRLVYLGGAGVDDVQALGAALDTAFGSRPIAEAGVGVAR
jgi:hypothetical protein